MENSVQLSPIRNGRETAAKAIGFELGIATAA